MSLESSLFLNLEHESSLIVDGRRGNQLDSQFVETFHTSAHSRSCFSLSWSPGGRSVDSGGLGILASGGGDGKIMIWQIYSSQSGGPAEGDGVAESRSRVGMTPIAAMRDAHGVSDVNSVAWCLREDSKGQGILASAGDDGGVRVWRVVAD